MEVVSRPVRVESKKQIQCSPLSRTSMLAFHYFHRSVFKMSRVEMFVNNATHLRFLAKPLL